LVVHVEGCELWMRFDSRELALDSLPQSIRQWNVIDNIIGYLDDPGRYEHEHFHA